ncbi:FAD-dependent monooxygenase [Streptomyces pactum]|uniref:FAD-dependent monooxygenase n=1 Tax=Streptomyces pactum TaxID=68249 RepID=A0ABS0NT48_9ACTN|nr:NAD(P)/FAD-dependent oxidoreductase [Streptomyces pactum]MBH5338400.1 FAD-dependent monooxygenase [Streptomyces pactum]
MARRSAIIVGSGVGGLTLAGMLTRHDWDVTVLERSAERRDGLAITIWPNALCAVRRAGGEDMYQALLKVCQPIALARMFGSGGRRLAALDLGFLQETYGVTGQGVTRAELLDTLIEQAGTDVRFGAGVVRAAPDGTVTLAGGEQLRADVVVGADGVGSTVRRGLLPPGHDDRRDNPLESWQGVVGRGGAWTYQGTDFHFGRKGTCGIMPLTGDRVYWFVDGSIDEPPTGEGWPDVVRELVSRTPADQLFPGQAWDRRPVRDWGRGRITLLGDAAHPILPTIGQGACMAMEDAGVLAARLVRSTDLPAALRAYESDRHPRVLGHFERARGMLRMRAMPAPLRDRVLASMPRPLLTRLFTRSALPLPEFRRPGCIHGPRVRISSGEDGGPATAAADAGSTRHGETP